MPAADDEFVALAVWLGRSAGVPATAEAAPAAPPAAACEPAQLDTLAREVRLLRARLADVEDALAGGR